jgi:hypothetical protein
MSTNSHWYFAAIKEQSEVNDQTAISEALHRTASK